MSKHKQVAFLLQGNSAFNALSGLNREVARALDSLGVSSVVLDFAEPGQASTLFNETLKAHGIENTLCAFCISGIGLQLGEGSPAGNLWQRFHIPAINWLLDHPAHMPLRNKHASATTINAYPNHDFITFQRNHIRSERTTAFLPFAPFMGGLQPKRRALGADSAPLIIFPKSGGNPVAKEAEWAQFPPLMVRIMKDAVRHYWETTDRVGPVHDSVLAMAADQGLWIENNIKPFSVMISEVDHYIRWQKSEIILRDLLKLPVRIYAKNMDYLFYGIDEGAKKATIVPPIDFAEMEKLYHEALAVVSVNPNVHDGAHDRVFSSLGSGALPVTDINPWLEANYPELVPYGYDFTSRSLTASIDRILADPQRAADVAWGAGEKARQESCFVDVIGKALALAATTRFANAQALL